MKNAMSRVALLALSFACASPLYALYNNGYLIASPTDQTYANTWLAEFAPPLAIQALQAESQTKTQSSVELDSLSGDIKFPSVTQPSIFEAQDTTFDVPETDFSRYGKAFSDH
ncbi:hypothetical protein [Cerasicoccus maritimus]|uniref:hypothetical protein n=1 Tax=Cerasicoccus maritimus TaxID=490089 RepID=UPI0028524AC6|nr:hypothetical protein [Cerasicoccus maritimus]